MQHQPREQHKPLVLKGRKGSTHTCRLGLRGVRGACGVVSRYRRGALGCRPGAWVGCVSAGAGCSPGALG